MQKDECWLPNSERTVILGRATKPPLFCTNSSDSVGTIYRTALHSSISISSLWGSTWLTRAKALSVQFCRKACVKPAILKRNFTAYRSLEWTSSFQYYIIYVSREHLQGTVVFASIMEEEFIVSQWPDLPAHLWPVVLGGPLGGVPTARVGSWCWSLNCQHFFNNVPTRNKAAGAKMTIGRYKNIAKRNGGSEGQLVTYWGSSYWRRNLFLCRGVVTSGGAMLLTPGPCKDVASNLC